VKVTIDGQVYEYDGRKAPTHEALWIEDVYKRNYGQWQIDLAEGSVKAFIMLACLIWRREGRNVDTAYQDVLDGKIDFDINEMSRSMAESTEAEEKAQAEAEKARAEADPTITGTSPDPDGSPGTGTATSPSSPANSTSGRGKSGSSKSRTSRP
jgi:hypothetical protein